MSPKTRKGKLRTAPRFGRIPVLHGRARKSEQQQPSASSPVRLRLYVIGDAPSSKLARNRLNEALSAADPLSYELEIVDCLDTPLHSRADDIVVTPTLMRLGPGPVQALVGSLSDRATLLTLLRGATRE